MRILVIHNSYLLKGGEDEVVAREAAMLEAHGHQVRVHQTSNEALARLGPLNAAVAAHWSTDAARSIEEQVREFKPDVAHVHNTFPLLSPAVHWRLRRLRVPNVMTLHNFRLACPQAQFFRDGRVCEDCLGHLPWRAVVHRCYRGRMLESAVAASTLTFHRALGTYARRVDRFIATTAFAKGKFIEMGLPAERIDVKPNFVDMSPASDIPGHRSGFVFVGRLSPEKGIDVLLKAIGNVDGAALTVIGDGPLRSLVENHPRVRYLGWQEPGGVRRELANAVALVMPSVWFETFGLVIIEAYACGLPVIASALGAMDELVVEGETGWRFAPGDAGALGTRLRWAMDNADELRLAGVMARAHYERHFTSMANLAQLEAVYDRAIQGHDRVE